MKHATVYIDEAGNTGSHITDPFQKFFVLAAVCYSNEELSQLYSDLKIKEILKDKEELHFVDLKKSTSGRKIILDFMYHHLVDEKHVMIEFIDKRFCEYAKIVDMIIEPVFYNFGTDLYASQNNIKLTNIFYFFMSNHANQELVHDLETAFETMIREQNSDSISKFSSIVLKLKNESIESLAHILSWIEIGLQDPDDFLPDEDNPYNLDTMMTSFVNLTSKWGEKIKGKIDVISDSSRQLKHYEKTIDFLRNCNPATIGYDTRKHQLPLPISSLLFADSKDYFGLQVADMIASLFAFRYNEPPKKFSRFHDEIKDNKFFQLPCFALAQASLNQLEQVIDSSEDVDPLNFLIDQMSKKS